MKLTSGPSHAPDQGLFHSGEKRRMIMLCVLFVVVATTFVVSLRKDMDKQGAAGGEPEAAALDVVVATPEVDTAELESLVNDATPEGRVVLGTNALVAAMDPARLLKDAHFEPMGGRELDAGELERIRTSPSDARGQLFRARGWIDELRAFDEVGEVSSHYRGRLRLEHGGHAYFVVQSLPVDRDNVGDFVRIDGLFLQLFRREGPEGPIDGPLIVGPRAVLSHPEIGVVAELAEDEFRFVEDDSVADGFTGIPFEEFWALASYVRHLDESTVDWSSAPLLDGELIGRLSADGDVWRGKPMRFPPARVQDIWNQKQPENPLRLERTAEAWLGSWEWARTTTGVVRVVLPFVNETVAKGDDVRARGFFLKNYAYEAAGGVAIAPFFVVTSMEVLPPPDKGQWNKLFGVIALSFVALVGFFAYMLVRDRRKSTELQEELVRRRRARRARTQPQSGS